MSPVQAWPRGCGPGAAQWLMEAQAASISYPWYYHVLPYVNIAYANT